MSVRLSARYSESQASRYHLAEIEVEIEVEIEQAVGYVSAQVQVPNAGEILDLGADR